MSRNNGSRKVTTAEELEARARKVVDLPSGMSIEVRRIGKGKLAEIIRGIPDVSALARLKSQTVKEVEAELAQGTVDQVLETGVVVTRMIEGVILAGVVSPKLFADPEQGPTPGYFTEEEQSILFNEICALSKFNQAAGEEVLPLSKTAG